MGRLASDGNDALLLTKLKILLGKALARPDGEERHQVPVTSYDNFVKFLDVDDPVAERVVESLVEDVFKVARRRKRTVDAARQSSFFSQPSSSSSRASHYQQQAGEHGQPESELARTTREALAAHRHERESRGREMEEYDAIIADAQRRVASPLPINQHEQPDNIVADTWEEFYADDTTTSAPWRRPLRNFNNAPSSAIFDSQDWPDLNSSVPFRAARRNRDEAYTATNATNNIGRRADSQRRLYQSHLLSDSDSEADAITAAGAWGHDSVIHPGWSNADLNNEQQNEDAASAILTDTQGERPRRVMSMDEHRRWRNIGNALTRAENERDFSSTSTRANHALQPSSAAVRHAVIERIERRRRERDEAASEAARQQRQIQSDMATAWRDGDFAGLPALPEALSRRGATVNQWSTPPSSVGARTDRGSSAWTSAPAATPSLLSPPSTSSIRASLEQNDSSDNRRLHQAHSSPASAGISSVSADVPRTDSSLPIVVGDDVQQPSISSDSTSLPATLRTQIDLPRRIDGQETANTASPGSSLQRNTSIRRSGFHASPQSLRRTSSTSSMRSILPRTSQNPLSSSLSSSAAGGAIAVDRFETTEEVHEVRNAFETFSSRARRAARDAREASAEAIDRDSQRQDSASATPQYSRTWTGEETEPLNATLPPAVFREDGSQISPFELLRSAFAAGRRAISVSSEGAAAGDAENVSELLGSSSSAAALGSSNTNTADDPSRYLSPPGAPIISRRQYPIGRSISSRQSSASSSSWSLGAEEGSSQSQPIVIRWPRATLPSPTIPLIDESGTPSASPGHQLLSLNEFLEEDP